ncbi:MAG: hypothetical protein FJ296_00580 [Planctomycetes bacterium]|nr:hypothetical protein [Planctomycetota bacterium]
MRSGLLAVACAAAGCSAPGYGHDRLLDASDILDVQYGTGFGLGVLAQATLWLEGGVGISSTGFMREWYGRRSTIDDEGTFVGLLAFTATGRFPHGSVPTSSFGVLFINVAAVLEDDPPETIDRFRFGGRLYLPGVNFGLFLNLGEIVDFAGGIAGFDPAADDGVPKTELW